MFATKPETIRHHCFPHPPQSPCLQRPCAAFCVATIARLLRQIFLKNFAAWPNTCRKAGGNCGQGRDGQANAAARMNGHEKRTPLDEIRYCRLERGAACASLGAQQSPPPGGNATGSQARPAKRGGALKRRLRAPQNKPARPVNRGGALKGRLRAPQYKPARPAKRGGALKGRLRAPQNKRARGLSPLALSHFTRHRKQGANRPRPPMRPFAARLPARTRTIPALPPGSVPSLAQLRKNFDSPPASCHFYPNRCFPLSA